LKQLLIIPTYNEADNIADVLSAVSSHASDFDVLFVDDSSPDGTGELIKKAQTENNKLHLVVRPKKNGLGRAYIAGFKWALEHGYDFIFEMDADMSHHPKYLKEMSRILTSCDVVVGSRNVNGGRIENWSAYRKFLSWGGSVYARLFTGMKVKDATAGFVGYKRKVLEAIDLDKIQSLGYAFQIEMKFAAHGLGFTIEETPITFVDRVKGESKLNGSIIKEAAIGVLSMRLKKWRGYNYAKV